MGPHHTADVRKPLTPIKADYSLAWVCGMEYVNQEGSGVVQRMREERGWSREDVYELTDYMLNPNELGMIEGEYGPGVPFEIEHLTTLAVLFGCRPGELLDRIYEEKGSRLLEEDD